MPLTTDYKKADVIVCVDVHNLVFRALNSPGPVAKFTNSQKYPTGYLFIALGKINAALRHYGLNQNLKTCLVLSAQENSERRRKKYPDYKAGRKHTELPSVEITDAFGRMLEKTPNPVEDFMELLCCLPVINLLMPDLWETDDALASFATHVRKVNKKAIVYILSNDRDLWERMGKKVICTSKPDAEFGIKDLEAAYGITNPRLLPLAKTLFGDSSDRIKKAVAGITETNIPKGFLDTVVVKKKQHQVDALVEAIMRYRKKNPGSKLEKILGKESELKAVFHIVKLRKKLKLDILPMVPNKRKAQKLLEWYELKTQMNNTLSLIP